ncbi:uncharacterized protein [Nicotiana tomentosiformis]|uniref:uncharacterized protein n=1 Tax=Nicotiana tomentosiformis TaxID=4098 RepID=UPI00388CABBD
MARTRTPSSAGRGTTRGGGQIGAHQTRRQAAPQPEVVNMGQPQVVMPDHVQEQGVQDAPPPVPTVVPTVTLPANAMAKLLNVLEKLVPTQGGSPALQATLQTQAPAQIQTFGNKEVSLQEFLKLKSPKFTGSDNLTDPQSLLDGTLKALRALGCSSERAVELATYKLEDMANTWYETVLLGRQAGAAPLTWDEFSKLFMDHFLPDSLRQKYARDFERLVQTPDMDVSTFNTKFCNLARYAPYLVPTQEARVQRFVDGLVGRLYTAVAPQMKTFSYVDAFDLARKIENKGLDERASSDLRKKIYATTPVYQTCGRSHLGQCRVLNGECFRCGQLVHHLRDCPQPPRNFSQSSIQSAAPTQTTHNTSGAAGRGNRGRGAGNRVNVNLGKGNTGRGESLFAEYVYRACQIRVEGRDTLADLIVLDMIDFDMFMGMDWLSSCYAIVDFHAKIVKFEIPKRTQFYSKKGQVPKICKVVSFMKAQRLLKKGCLSLLAIVNDTREETISIENILVVREFSDVFPEDLPGLPPVREIDFDIDLPPNTQPISIPPYWMAPA